MRVSGLGRWIVHLNSRGAQGKIDSRRTIFISENWKQRDVFGFLDRPKPGVSGLRIVIRWCSGWWRVRTLVGGENSTERWLRFGGVSTKTPTSRKEREKWGTPANRKQLQIPHKENPTSHTTKKALCGHPYTRPNPTQRNRVVWATRPIQCPMERRGWFGLTTGLDVKRNFVGVLVENGVGTGRNPPLLCPECVEGESISGPDIELQINEADPAFHQTIWQPRP